ncbi:putative inorganic pyrophosphatase [Trypanosoma theileri]|uniref:inorganic diphosphatase n=1 Tax=Trypanosoma theileri TaxID=67003 RepID=A0A1X0PAB0_9TRYP|nr:putative inorganic pyrophosphatase [Trypanosoma theileri]ORC93390.1 putative inorganic pyrophosphatase [Trypanosoma theileri]
MLCRTRVAWLVATSGVTLPKWVTREEGTVGTHTWRMFFECQNNNNNNNNDINKINKNNNITTTATMRPSAWHDLALHPCSDSAIITFVCEIPKGTRAKMELMKEEVHNPLAQDVHRKKPGKPLRFFTYGDIPFNYGFAPRTWEDPTELDADTRCHGDGDPIDVVHLGGRPAVTGAVQAVRVLGVLGLIDEGETDWKIIVEPYGDPHAYGSLANVPQELREGIVKWFREYKTTDGKGRNELTHGGEIRGVEDAMHVIGVCARQYENLISGTTKNPGYWLR